MPKKQTTAAKKARAIQRADGGKHTTLLADQYCGRKTDPWGIEDTTCNRPPHPEDGLCSEYRHFDAQAAMEQARQEDAEQQAIIAELTAPERAADDDDGFEEDYDDGRTYDDHYEDMRSSKYED